MKDSQHSTSHLKVNSATSRRLSDKLSQNEDIIEMILEDHKPLKQLIKIMKNTDKDLSDREDAFAEFAPLLICHAKPEEESLYTFMKSVENTRSDGFEGDVEHGLADQMVEEIMRTDDEDLWSARVKVLAELVEHHIEEEENSLLPDFKKNSNPQDRQILANKFLKLKTHFLQLGGEETPHEANLKKSDLHH